MKEKLLVYSMDALVHEDLEYLRTKPNFSRLMADCAEVEHIRTVYPSLTYPAHVSIATGCRPGKHGIISNTSFQTVNDGKVNWLLSSDLIQAEDIYAAAKRAGCTTASVYWPVMGNNPNIDYLINEYFFPDPGESILDGFARQGASEDALKAVKDNLDRFPNHHTKEILSKNTTFDDFINGCACSMIRRYQPDLLLVHNCYMDTTRHRYGLFTEHNSLCLDYLDEWLGELTAAMEDAGVYETTNFVLLSDHGQLDFVRRIKPNVLLCRGGFIDRNADGTVRSWRAFAQSNGMSFSVYLKDPKDAELHRQVFEYLKKLADDGVWGFEQIQTAEEVKERYGLYGPFSFLAETDGYSAFADSWEEPVLNPIDLTDYRLGKATHGYQPEKGPQPVFLGRGPAFRAGARLERGEIINEAPTFAKILGAELPDAEGICMSELLK